MQHTQKQKHTLIYMFFFWLKHQMNVTKTRGPKGHISCTWVPCTTFLSNPPGWPFLFTDRPEKHNLGRGRYNLAFCQASLNSIQWFQRKSWKSLSQSEAGAAILLFSIGQKKHKTGRGRWNFATSQVSLNSVQRFLKRSQKCFSQSEVGASILFFWSALKHKNGRGRWYLASFQRIQRRSKNTLYWQHVIYSM